MEARQAVSELGELIGYGRMMQLASKLWQESLKAKGYPPGGAFSVGPCIGSLDDFIIIRISSEGDPSVGIFGSEAKLSLDKNDVAIMDEYPEDNMRADFAKQLGKLFSFLWSEPVIVQFGDKPGGWYSGATWCDDVIS